MRARAHKETCKKLRNTPFKKTRKDTLRRIANCKGLLKDSWFASALWTSVLYSDDPFYRKQLGIKENELEDLIQKDTGL